MSMFHLSVIAICFRVWKIFLQMTADCLFFLLVKCRFSFYFSDFAIRPQMLKLMPTLNICGCLNVYVLCPPQAEDTDMRLSLPECHPSRYPLLTLAKDYQNMKLPPDMFMPGEIHSAPPPKLNKSRWRNITHAE